jgi:branched-subunit amino acid transport protein
VTDVWVTIALLTVTAAIIRASGPMALGGRELRPWAASAIELLAPALLAALIVVQTVGGDDGLDTDERIAGVAAAGVVLTWRRSAMLWAIAVAALVAAGLRAVL